MKIETARTYIREFTLADAEAVLKFNSNAQVTKYTGDAGMVNSLEQARQVISDIWLAEYSKHGYGRWAVVDKASDTVIGFCGLKFIPSLGIPDIGYRFFPEYWGKGYATETAKACIAYCNDHLGVHEYFADVMADNIASVKLIRKLGLKFNGFIQEDGFTFMRFMRYTPTLLNTNQFYK